MIWQRQLCGLVLLAMYLIQVGLGVYIHRRRSTGASTHPVRNVVHIIFGLVIIGSAVFQVSPSSALSPSLKVFQVKGGMHEWEAKTGRSVSPKWIKIWGAWSLVSQCILDNSAEQLTVHCRLYPSYTLEDSSYCLVSLSKKVRGYNQVHSTYHFQMERD